MKPLLLAVRDFRQLVNTSGGSFVDGQKFIESLHSICEAYQTDSPPTRENTPVPLMDLSQILKEAELHIRTNDGSARLSYALTLLSNFQQNGWVQSALAEKPKPTILDITPALPSGGAWDRGVLQVHSLGEVTPINAFILERGGLDFSGSNKRIITNPKTNDRGYLMTCEPLEDNDDQGLFLEIPSSYVLSHWDHNLRRYIPIASGGNSEVYLAHEDDMPRPIAIKIAAFRNKKDAEATLKGFRNGRYFQTLLGSEPCYVHVYRTGLTHDGSPFIAMERMRGNLADYLSYIKSNESFRLTEEQNFYLGLQVITPVAIMHKKRFKTSDGIIEGVGHGDIKPENILFSEQGYLKLADFDLAKFSTHFSSEEKEEGTPGYFIHKEREGIPQDVFALGATIFRLYTQKSAFTGNSPFSVVRNVIEKPTDELAQELDKSSVPADVMQIILKSLERNLENRYQDAAELFLNYASYRAKRLEKEAKRILYSDVSESGRDRWKRKVEDALREYDQAIRQYPHPEINEWMIALHKQLIEYASKRRDLDSIRYSQEKIRRLTPRGLPPVPIRS